MTPIFLILSMRATENYSIIQLILHPAIARRKTKVSDVRCQVSGVRCQASGVRCQASGVSNEWISYVTPASEAADLSEQETSIIDVGTTGLIAVINRSHTPLPITND